MHRATNVTILNLYTGAECKKNLRLQKKYLAYMYI